MIIEGDGNAGASGVQGVPATALAVAMKAANVTRPDAGKLAALEKAVAREAEGIEAVKYTVLKRLLGHVATDPKSQELARRAYHGMVRELGGDGATGAERLLVENVAMSWLKLQNVEMNHSLKSPSEFWERRLAAAQVRFDRAVAALTRYRRVPVKVQVNLAHQQINMA